MYKKILLFTLIFFNIEPASIKVLQSPYMRFTKQNVPLSFARNPASYPLNMINKGEMVYKKIQQGDTASLQSNMLEYMQSIIGLMFYFFSQAIEKNQGFTNGAFVIKDPGFKVYNFLYQFVEKKWQPKDMFKEINVDVSGIGAYPRQSTHLNDYYKYTNKTEKGWFGTSKKKEFTHYGIDLPKGYEMPTLKKHILFAKEETNPPLTYIKLEDHGLGKSGVIQHAGGLVKSKVRKYVNKAATQYKKLNFKEEAYLSQLINNMADAIGSDDSADSRRERVPAETVTQFFALLLSPGSAVSKKEVDENSKRIKALGVQGMIALLDAYAQGSLGSPAWRDEARNLAQEIRKQYDHIDIRIGREVILIPDEELKL